MALNADATFETCPLTCDKGLLPTILLWKDILGSASRFGETFSHERFANGANNIINSSLNRVEIFC